MKRAVRAAAVLLALALAIFISPVAIDAAGSANYEKAVDLKILGLFSGFGKNFDLGRAPSRADAGSMLVCLLGAGKTALQTKYLYPFTDVPSSSSAIIGYLYHLNLLNAGNGKFGPNQPVTAQEYTTWLLRALGYDDRSGDFITDGALDKASQLGLLSTEAASALKSGKAFNWDDMAGISYNALSIKLKGSAKTLLDKLVNDDKAVFKPAATVLGLYTSDLAGDLGNIGSFNPPSTEYGYRANNINDFFLILRKALYQNDTSFSIDARGYSGDLKGDFSTAFGKAYKIVKQLSGVDNFMTKWTYISTDNVMSVTVTYSMSKTAYEIKRDKAGKALNKARQVVFDLVGKDMSAFDREKVLHDYIVNNTRYDIAGYNSGNIPEDDYTEYGSLINGKAVCQGYTEAMKLLSDLSGIECVNVSGLANNGVKWEDHTWNIVNIDGEWYHLDTTFDDPVMKDGEDVLTYNYFNLNDSEVANIYSWIKSNYPACKGVKSGYYYKNNMITGNRDEFVKAVAKAVELRKPSIELKVKDYSKSKYSDLPKIVFSTKAVKKFNFMIDDVFGIIRIYNIKYS